MIRAQGHIEGIGVLWLGLDVLVHWPWCSLKFNILVWALVLMFFKCISKIKTTYLSDLLYLGMDGWIALKFIKSIWHWWWLMRFMSEILILSIKLQLQNAPVIFWALMTDYDFDGVFSKQVTLLDNDTCRCHIFQTFQGFLHTAGVFIIMVFWKWQLTLK